MFASTCMHRITASKGHSSRCMYVRTFMNPSKSHKKAKQFTRFFSCCNDCIYMNSQSSQATTTWTKVQIATTTASFLMGKKNPGYLMSLLSFLLLFRGLFASHYIETHYMEDGSAVSSAHNYTV